MRFLKSNSSIKKVKIVCFDSEVFKIYNKKQQAISGSQGNNYQRERESAYTKTCKYHSG